MEGGTRGPWVLIVDISSDSFPPDVQGSEVDSPAMECRIQGEHVQRCAAVFCECRSRKLRTCDPALSMTRAPEQGDHVEAISRTCRISIACGRPYSYEPDVSLHSGSARVAMPSGGNDMNVYMVVANHIGHGSYLLATWGPEFDSMVHGPKHAWLKEASEYSAEPEPRSLPS